IVHTGKKMLQRYGSLSGKLLMIELEKDPDAQGLGIWLTGNKSSSRARMSVYVEYIDPEGPAGSDGRIRVGDELLEINGQILYGRSHQNATTIINNAPAKVKIILIRRSTTPSLPPPPSISCPVSLSQPSSSNLSSSVSSSPIPNTAHTTTITHSDRLKSVPVSTEPQNCPIVPGKETAIEIHKGNLGLGLSIVGGCDTLLGAVIIHEVNDGDQILEVNGIDLRLATHDEAIGVLRLTTQRVSLCVFRHQEAYREEDLWDVFSLELRPRPGEGLGFTTVGKSNDTGIFVSDIIRGSTADSDGRLLLGDQILSINGEDVRAASQDHAEKLLQKCNVIVHLEVARFKAGIQYSQRTSFLIVWLMNPYYCLNVFILFCMPSSQGPCDTLGISLAGGPHSNAPPFIAAMDTNGLAAKTQQLQMGDRILSINGVSTKGMTHVQAGALLKTASGSVSVEVKVTAHCSLLPQNSSRVERHVESPPLLWSGLQHSGGFGSPHGDLPIYGAAIEEGRLKRGDQIIAVNGHCLEGVTHAEAVEILKKTMGTVVLTVLS
uniref:PDZ domain-containing protein n=1 Tax=Neogobius melanostomus TaxID=47308 RepID=A0A8C6UAG4_9GOBI